MIALLRIEQSTSLFFLKIHFDAQLIDEFCVGAAYLKSANFDTLNRCFLGSI
jgi:hypothetical protein